MTAAIRKGRMSDLDALLAIEAEAFSGDRLSRRSFQRLLGNDSSSLLVAESQGDILGYALVLFRKASALARLYSVAVRASRPLAGTGRALLAAAEEAARSRGAEEMRLEVREDNARAISLYERSGYRRFGLRPDYYADGATALRYTKQISNRNGHA
jgi:ribosomal-protein-alanine acetyltransferase